MMFIIVLLSYLSLSSGSILSDIATQSASINCPYANNRLVTCPLANINNSKPIDPVATLIKPLLGKLVSWNAVTKNIGLPVVKMTYDGSNKWNGYDVPKEVKLTNHDLGQANVQSTSFASINDWFNAKTIGINIIGGSFSTDQDIINIYNGFFGDDCSMVLTQESRIAFHLDLDMTNWTQDDMFARVEAYLPIEYDDTIYNELIKYWGTHFIGGADYGCLSELAVGAKTCAYSTTDIRNQVQQELMKTLYGQYQTINLDTNYVQKRRSSGLDIFGGNPTVMDWNERIKTIIDAPAIVNFNILPLDKFIINPSKRDNVAKVIANYINQYNQQQTQNFNNAKQQFMNPKPIMLVRGTDFPNPVNSQRYTYAPINGSPYVPHQLAGNSQVTEGSGDLVIGTCSRNNDGYMVATIAFKGQTINGNWVKSGCSIAERANPFFENTFSTFEANFWPKMPIKKPNGFTVMCCMFCTPVTNDITYSWSQDHWKGTETMHYFDCGCPNF